MGGAQSSEMVSNGQLSPEGEFIRSKIADNCVVIFSKTTCSFCGTAKRTFDKLGVPYEVVELNQRPDGSRIQSILGAMTGASTVPRVFVNGNCIGGCSETQALHRKGKLKALIDGCGT